MSLKTVLKVLQAGTVLVILCLVAYSITRVGILIWVAWGLAFVVGGLWLVFGRCPHCRRYLGRAEGSYCPHCGHKLDL